MTLLGEEMQQANPDLDAIERWRAKDAEFIMRSAEVESSRVERDTVGALLLPPQCLKWHPNIAFALETSNLCDMIQHGTVILSTPHLIAL